MLILRRILLTMAMLLLIVYMGLIVFAYWPYGEGIPVAELADEDDLFVTVDGISLRYQTWGTPQPDQPTIVLLHGFANSVYTFRQLGPLLGENHYVLAVDLPGFGLSDKPDDHDYGNISQANVVEAFIRILGLEQVIIGGHSLGGTLAVHLAIDTPEIIGVFLMNPGIISTGVPPATQYMVFPFPRIAAKTFADRAFRERFLKMGFVNDDLVTEEVMDETMLATQTPDYIAGATQLMRYYVAGDELAMLDDIRVPVLIIWGALDSNKPAGEGQQIQKLIPNSKLVVIDHVGHYVHEEATEQTAAAVVAAKGFWAQRR